MNTITEPSERVLRLDEVAALTGLAPSTVRARATAAGDDFPRPRRLGRRSIGWLYSDLIEWLRNRPLREPARAASGSRDRAE